MSNHPANMDPSLGSGGGALGASASALGGAASESQQSLKKSQSQSQSVSSGTTTKTGRGGKSGSRAGTAASVDMTMFVDQAMVKQWNRCLGILFYEPTHPGVRRHASWPEAALSN